ncbi:MAG: YfcE family phosphodiesterase [Gemmataceae bacterium]|nr:YfcE family phosphodiesterase [Gemmataceae bacterium]
MKVGIVSDTHDQVERTVRALAMLREEGASMVLHCGDIESPGCVEPFAGWDAHFVFGNCDWDKDGLRHAMGRAGATLHERFGHLEIEGVRLAWLHGDDGALLRDVEASGAYAFLFHGHTHVAMERRSGPTRVINPGALHRASVKTCLLLDLPSGEARQLEVG